MRGMIAVVSSVVLILGCASLAGDDKRPAVEPAQGVKGKVVKMTGNFMPSIGPRRNGGTSAPLSVPVHVFKGKVKPFETPDPKHPQLATVVNSDKDGSFSVALEPGEYTLVAEIKGKLYLNCFVDNAGGMAWCPTTVMPGKWTDVHISDSSEAVF